jgi:hypothetical protein
MSARTISSDSFKPLIVRALILPVFLVMAFAGVILWQVARLISAQGWVAHTDEVISQAIRKWKAMFAAFSSPPILIFASPTTRPAPR